MPLCSNIERIELGDGRYFFGIAAETMFGLDRKLMGQDLGLDADHQRHRALARLEAELCSKRRPRTILLVLPSNAGKLDRIAHVRTFPLCASEVQESANTRQPARRHGAHAGQIVTAPSRGH